jgi:hypothetical protein
MYAAVDTIGLVDTAGMDKAADCKAGVDHCLVLGS